MEGDSVGLRLRDEERVIPRGARMEKREPVVVVADSGKGALGALETGRVKAGQDLEAKELAEGGVGEGGRDIGVNVARMWGDVLRVGAGETIGTEAG